MREERQQPCRAVCCGNYPGTMKGGEKNRLSRQSYHNLATGEGGKVRGFYETGI